MFEANHSRVFPEDKSWTISAILLHLKTPTVENLATHSWITLLINYLKRRLILAQKLS